MKKRVLLSVLPVVAGFLFFTTPVLAVDSHSIARHQSLTTVYNTVSSVLKNRFQNIDSVVKPKVVTKIADKTKAGKNVSAANAKLAEYSTSQYSTDIAAFNSKYQELSTVNSIPVDSVVQLAKLANNARTDLNSMRQTLLDAFRLAARTK